MIHFQETDSKKWEKKEASGPPLQTASMSVRALIEEKIIQKRTTKPNQNGLTTYSGKIININISYLFGKKIFYKIAENYIDIIDIFNREVNYSFQFIKCSQYFSVESH